MNCNRVLVVEDDTSLMLTYTKIIDSRPDWSATFCSNYEEGINELLKNKFDIIISDGITSSNIDGECFLGVVAVISPQSLRVLISGSILPVDSCVVQKFIHKKDFTANELLTILANYQKVA